MNSDYAAAMRRALESTRAQRPAEATAIIQQALGAAGGATHAPAGATRPRFSLLDPAANGPRHTGSARTAISTAASAAAAAPRRAGDTGRAEAPAAPRLPFSVIDGQRHPGRLSGTAGLTAPRLRRSLREVVANLSHGRPGGPLPAMRRPSTPPAIPEGARWEARSFASPAESRDYRLYVPAGQPVQGLVVMLHGCTQNPEDFATGTGMNAVAEAHGLLVAWPEQTGAHNPSSCWNWFRPGDQRRGAGEPAVLAGLARALAAEFGLGRERTFVAGLSAGGAMAAVMAEAYSDLFAAVGIHSGLPVGSAHDVPSAFAAMRGEGPGHPPRAANGELRTIVFHGTADRTVHPGNGERIVAAALSGPGRVERAEARAAGGRSYSRTTVSDVAGRPTTELWLVDGAGHAWSGGSPSGSYTDPAGPDASGEMVRFFLASA